MMGLLDLRMTASATQVAAADASSQALQTLSDASEVARVPEIVVFHKAAGTAYSAATGFLRLVDEDGAVWALLPVAGLLDSASEKARAVKATAGAFSAGNKTLSIVGDGTITADTGSPGITITAYYRNVVLK
jgi:hypothetical protein